MEIGDNLKDVIEFLAIFVFLGFFYWMLFRR